MDKYLNQYMYDAGAEGGQGTNEPNNDPAKGNEPKEQMIPKHRFDEVYSQMKTLKEQVDAYNTEKVNADKQALEQKQEFKTLYEQTQSELNTYKTKITECENTKGEYEKLLTDMVATKLNNVPEEFRSLIPDGMTPTQKLNWLSQAEEKGLFKKGMVTEIGKPMNIGGQKIETQNLTPKDMLKFAFSSKKK